MYELLRPICRASVAEETVHDRKKSQMNLKSQTMAATLKEAEVKAKEALESVVSQQIDQSTPNKPQYP